MDLFEISEEPKSRMEYFIKASYRFFPDLTEIRDWETQFHSGTKSEDVLTCLRDNHHEVFGAKAVAVYIDDAWKTVDEGEFGEMFDAGANCPVIYVEATTPFGIGIDVRHNARTILDDSWLSDYTDMFEWGDVLLDVAEKITDLTKEHFISLLHRLTWESSIDWESGNDEGEFTIAEDIERIPRNNCTLKISSVS